MSPQGRQSSFAVGRGTSGSSCIAAGLNRASSRVEEETSGFLCISDFNCRVSAELEQESQASSCVEAWNSAFLSSSSWGVRPLVELYLEPVAFSRGCNWSVSDPSCVISS